MRTLWAICGKEVRIYLTTWTSYVLFGAFTLISAFFFQRLVIEYQYRSMQAMPEAASGDGGAGLGLNLTDWVMGPLFMNMTVFLLFLLPILTMRLLSEERRGRTLELLMTTPIRPIHIVLGKYAAGVLMLVLMLGLTALFPLLLSIYGGTESGPALDWRSVGAGYAGLTLLGAAFVAIGLFASSLSDSPIVAVVVSFAILLMLYVIGLAARGQSGPWQQVFTFLAINTHLEAFIRGVVRSVDLTYYASLIFTGLYLTHRVVEAQRWR
jgi:ABC-2 type transport system permease protein